MMLQADDDILPVHREALRQWFVEFLTDLGHQPSVEDWYRFMRGVEERSLIKIRAMEREDFLLDEALRQAAAEVGMVLVTMDLEERKH